MVLSYFHPVCKVIDSESTLLMANVTAKEIWAAIWVMDGDKVPGPDGFPHSSFNDIGPLFVMGW